MKRMKKHSLMKIFDAMILIGGINGEWNTVQTFAAHNATKAFWMVWFAIGSKNSLKNRFNTNRTLFQCVQIVFFTARFTVERIKWFSLQIDLALTARKTLNVIDLLHGRATRSFANHSFTALHTNTKTVRISAHIHRLYQQFGQYIDFSFTETIHFTARAHILIGWIFCWRQMKITPAYATVATAATIGIGR